MRQLDLCTGSGCVAIAMARQRPTAQVFASDISDDALIVARDNALRLGAYNVAFYKCDLFAPFRGRRFDVVTANPPYIPTGDLATLMPDVRDHEPRLALDGGEDGLAIVRRIALDAPEYLEKGGLLAIEVGAGEAPAAAALFTEQGFAEKIEVHPHAFAATGPQVVREQIVFRGQDDVGGLLVHVLFDQRHGHARQPAAKRPEPAQQCPVEWTEKPRNALDIENMRELIGGARGGPAAEGLVGQLHKRNLVRGRLEPSIQLGLLPALGRCLEFGGARLQLPGQRNRLIDQRSRGDGLHRGGHGGVGCLADSVPEHDFVGTRSFSRL